MKTISYPIGVKYNDTSHRINVSVAGSAEELHALLRENGITDFSDDTTAYADTWSVEKSLENGLDNPDCSGSIYLIKDADYSTIAHEATHMALGIMSRAGKKTLRFTTAQATPTEEDFCELVGILTEELVLFMAAYNSKPDYLSSVRMWGEEVEAARPPLAPPQVSLRRNRAELWD